LAVVVGLNGRPAPILQEFAVADSDRAAVNDLVARVAVALDDADTGQRSIILAALAELSARYMQPEDGLGPNGEKVAVNE
jgi:hypothetical protein